MSTESTTKKTPTHQLYQYFSRGRALQHKPNHWEQPGFWHLQSRHQREETNNTCLFWIGPADTSNHLRDKSKEDCDRANSKYCSCLFQLDGCSSCFQIPPIQFLQRDVNCTEWIKDKGCHRTSTKKMDCNMPKETKNACYQCLRFLHQKWLTHVSTRRCTDGKLGIVVVNYFFLLHQIC